MSAVWAKHWESTRICDWRTITKSAMAMMCNIMTAKWINLRVSSIGLWYLNYYWMNEEQSCIVREWFAVNWTTFDGIGEIVKDKMCAKIESDFEIVMDKNEIYDKFMAWLRQWELYGVLWYVWEESDPQRSVVKWSIFIIKVVFWWLIAFFDFIQINCLPSTHIHTYILAQATFNRY